ATGDVRHGFVNSFPNDKSVIVVDERFAPETTDFRSLISRVAIQKPDALIILTQTGRPLGLILKQWAAQNLPIISISTTFVAAANPDAAAIAGPLINGVKYMAPAYDVDGEEWQRFLSLYQQEYGKSPAIEFHAAGVVDSLN